LLKQYLKLGTKLLAFNVDENFCDFLDGLLVVDLRNTELRILERLIGGESATILFACRQTAAMRAA
jgi:hypothetical protein